MTSPSFADLAQERISTSPGCLMKAFEYVIETAGRRQVTDLHVRRLLNYVRAHDRYYTGVKVSLAQLASILFLSVPTCRRVIRRAVNEFNLLIVIPQRHHPGGQTVNRYTINWDNVDATLYDIELAQCAANDASCSDAFIEFPTSLAPNHQSPEVSLSSVQPTRPRAEGPAICLAQAKAAKRDAGLGINAQEDLGGLKARPFATANDSSRQSSTHPESTASSTTNSSSRSPRDIEKLIFENRLLSCHPRVLRIPERLIPKVWPYTVRRYPKETPLELIAHLNVLLFKLQTAMDRAQKLNSKKIFYRLRTLYFKLNAVHRRACHGAMCRTNLPPTKPFTEYSRNSTPLDRSTDPTDGPSEQELYELALANVSEHASLPPLKSSNTQDLNPVALCDQPPVQLESLRSSSSSAAKLSLESSENLVPDLESLIVTLDELLSDLNSALQSARDHRSYWLQNRFTTLRRSIKGIRSKAQSYSPSNTPTTSHVTACSPKTAPRPSGSAPVRLAP